MKKKVKQCIAYFEQQMPVAETELNYKTPYELVVAVILSAQCTDKRVNLITPTLFKKYPDFVELSTANIEDIFSLIRSCSYPNSKSKYLLDMSQMVISQFKGKLPKSREELESIPGIGRKTANVLLSVLYNLPYFAVDTHVFRVAERIGLTVNAKNPIQAEEQLTAAFPEELIPKAHHWLILHGRYTCKAIKPNCSECGISNICSYFLTQKLKKTENKG